MAISVGRTLKELTKMADDLDLTITPSGKNNRVMKEDLIIPIRDHFLQERYGSNIPKHMQLMLDMKSPMLALRIDELKPDQQEEVWNDPEWELEQKLNGVRCRVVNDGNGIHLYSRHNSDSDLLPIEFTDKILFPDACDLDHLKKEFIIDCEMESDNPNICTIMENSGVVTNSQLQAVTSLISSTTARAHMIQKNNNLRLVFNSFDCVYYDGQWVMAEPLSKRRALAEEIVQELEKCGFNIRRVLRSKDNSKEGKQKFYNGIISRGGEGCIAKRSSGLYIPDTTRNFNGWIKLKRNISSAYSSYSSVEDAMGDMGDTIDAFITGYEPGSKDGAFEHMIGSVAISVYVKKKDGTTELREIGKFGGMELSLREDMTEIINGEVTLNPKYMNRVCEIDAMSMSSRNMRFQHCRFLGFRYDKLPDSCILTEEFLESQVF
jgi:ATP-dependent DNA ligase